MTSRFAREMPPSLFLLLHFSKLRPPSSSEMGEREEREREREREIHTRTHTHMYVYVGMYDQTQAFT
jgi:hypothetical protein